MLIAVGVAFGHTEVGVDTGANVSVAVGVGDGVRVGMSCFRPLKPAGA